MTQKALLLQAKRRQVQQQDESTDSGVSSAEFALLLDSLCAGFSVSSVRDAVRSCAMGQCSF